VSQQWCIITLQQPTLRRRHHMGMFASHTNYPMHYMMFIGLYPLGLLFFNPHPVRQFMVVNLLHNMVRWRALWLISIVSGCHLPHLTLERRTNFSLEQESEHSRQRSQGHVSITSSNCCVRPSESALAYGCGRQTIRPNFKFPRNDP